MSRPGSKRIFNRNEEKREGRSASSACTGRKLRKCAWKLALLLMLSMTTTTTAWADEVLIGIDDGPVSDEELGITDQDLTTVTDGSMIPEYKISNISETSANVVSDQYTVAQDSAATETTKESAASTAGKETLLEVADTVDDFAAFKSGSSSASSSTSTSSSMVDTVKKNVVHAATSILNNVKSTTQSSTADAGSTKSGAAVTVANSILSAAGNVIEAATSKGPTGTSLPVIATTASRQALIQYAKQFLGNPYVYGGTSLTDGADCSGFVQQIFKHFGIDTGRSSRDQYAKAQSISFSELQPGDLVFYGSGDYINHVAIYAGDGVIIHAANSRTGICTGRYNYREPAGYGRFLQN